jgi:hypothetical protein
MKRVQLAVAVALVVGLTVVSGVIYGRMTNRWGLPPDTLAAAEKLKGVPDGFGDWRLQGTEDLDKSALEMLDPAGYFMRRYENRKTGDVVSVTVLLGLPGPISVHTPEICFGSQNYTSRGERRKVSIRAATGAEDEFWALDFKLDNLLQGGVLRSYYAWSSGDRWVAPKDARFWSAGMPYLYKIQLSAQVPVDIDAKSDDPCQKFLRDFVPVLKNHLVDPTEG